LAALLLPAAATQAASPAVTPAAASTPIAAAHQAATVSGRKIALGLSMDPNTSDTDWPTVQTMKDTTGRYPALWSIWSTWGDRATRNFPGTGTYPNKNADKAFMAHLKANHITPVIVWQPTDAAQSGKYRNQQVIAGKFDPYIHQWAKAAKAYGSPIVLRFAQEMNGAWNPWGPGVFIGNTSSSYIKMWKHVYKIFRGAGGEGATNVKFLWSPFQPCGDADCVPYSDVWVGDKFVDYIGFSSFNWLTRPKPGEPVRPWRSMVDAYKTDYKKITALSHKPIIVAESASNRVSSGSNTQAQWIKDGYPAAYKAYPQIAAILYFNINMKGSGDPQQANWMFTPAAVQAYSALLTNKHFRGTLP